MNKKFFKRLLVAGISVCTALFFTACGGSTVSREENSKNSSMQSSADSAGESKKDSAGSENQKLQIVTTIFPEYDWVKEILGEKADNTDLTLLLGNGTDMHSFQPTMADILKVSTCDDFI